VLVVASTHLAPLHAQSAGTPAVAGGDDQPWNRGVSPETRRAARDLFLEGNRLFRVPLFVQAAEKYAAALARWKHPAFYFNLAVTQLNLGQELEARNNLEQAIKHGAEPLGVDEFNEAQKQLRDVERQLGQIHITCQTPGAEITLDGATLFTGPGSHRGWVKAAAHEITAKKQGYISEAQRVTVAPGALRETELKLITLSEATDTSRRWAAWKPWTVVAGGVAVAAAAGAVHTLSSRNFNAYDANFALLPCAKEHGCDASQIPSDLSAQLDRARLEQRIAIGGYLAGGVLIGTGAVLLYMNRPRLQEPGAARAAEGVAIVPTASRDSVGVLVMVSR
jgi:tetratricopeptide (TPR) repeat protein